MKKVSGAFYGIIWLFFFWGFVAASNDILIPLFKDKLQLEQWQSQIISFVFYIAYTVGALLYFTISKFIKKDLLLHIGYSNGLVIGLLISLCGILFFIPAANTGSFFALIIGLFIIGLGFSLQQTAANPLVILSGDPDYGSQRLSLAGGINNVGTTIGPFLIAMAVFGTTSNTQTAQLEYLKYPYLILGLAFALAALLIFIFSKKLNTGIQQNSAQEESSSLNILYVIKKQQVWMGMLAIFTYVGVEVSSVSNLSEFAMQKANISTQHIAPFISLYWASLMIGRWASSADIFSETKWKQILLKIILPIIALLLFVSILFISNKELINLKFYLPFVVLLIILDLLSKGSAARQIMIYSIAGIITILLGIMSEDIFSVYCITATGLFCSTLWPCIFELSIKGLKKDTGTASGLLIMMIMGGGWISVLQGYLSKFPAIGISGSYYVGITCFIYLALFGLKNKSTTSIS